MLKYLPYVLLMALSTAIVYGWGLAKKQNQSKDLMVLLYDKGSSKVMKALKKKGSLSRKDVEQILDHTTASLFYSKNRLTVQDPKAFADSLLKTMIEHHMIEEGTGADAGRYFRCGRKK